MMWLGLTAETYRGINMPEVAKEPLVGKYR